MQTRFEDFRQRFHAGLIESVLTFDPDGVPSIADKANRSSIAIAQTMVRRLGDEHSAAKVAGQRAGNTFEQHVELFLHSAFATLSHLRPGKWEIKKANSRKRNAIAEFEQYEHLVHLQNAALQDAQLAAALGNDYSIAPDIVLLRYPESDESINANAVLVDDSIARLAPLRLTNNELPLIHASISCKWTLRSDRAQNARSEALNLIRNRKGRCPHIVVVTAEPTPSRLSSLALGTGDLDCVYHLALPELQASVEAYGIDDTTALLRNMIDGKRLKDISDLPLDLAI